MALRIDKFKARETWAVGRMHEHIMVQKDPIDVYFLLDAATRYALGQLLVQGDVPDQKDVESLFLEAHNRNEEWPKELLIPKGDPAEEVLRSIADKFNIRAVMVPEPYLAPLFKELHEGFAQFLRQGLPTTPADPTPQEDLAQAKMFIPDSYDPCWCNSGKKFKFCCKPIFREIVMAMAAVEDGRFSEAVGWMEKAKSKVGETGEILCRYSIIHRLQSREKSMEYLQRALQVSPNHPRSHYLLALEHKESGRLQEAESSYLEAIKNYPSTDRFHLNEAWNNLGTVYFDLGQFQKAKVAWEKAVMYSPSDRVAKENIKQFIYDNPTLPSDIRAPSPFIARYL